MESNIFLENKANEIVWDEFIAPALPDRWEDMVEYALMSEEDTVNDDVTTVEGFRAYFDIGNEFTYPRTVAYLFDRADWPALLNYTRTVYYAD